MPAKIQTEKILYIFIHIHRTAGTTLRLHIEKNFSPEEVMLLYKSKDNNFENRQYLDDHLSRLTKERIDKIKIICGHGAYYGIHRFFAKIPRYITFFRNPAQRVISNYNFFRQTIHKGHKSRESIFLKTKAVMPFEDWFESSPGMHNYMAKLLIKNFSSLDSEPTHENLGKVKKILDEFYFIGIPDDNNQDLLFLYHKLDIKRFYENQLISKKYFNPENPKAVKDFIISKNQSDQLLYEYALQLNSKFKENNSDFSASISEADLKRRIYMSSLRPRIRRAVIYLYCQIGAFLEDKLPKIYVRLKKIEIYLKIPDKLNRL